MSNTVYNTFLDKIIRQQLNLETASLKVMLMNDTYVPDRDLHQIIGDISGFQITGTGYTAGGMPLTGVTFTRQDASDSIKVAGSDVTWPNSSLTAKYAVVYETTAGTLVTCFGFDANKTSVNGNFTVQWSTSGIFTLSQAV